VPGDIGSGALSDSGISKLRVSNTRAGFVPLPAQNIIAFRFFAARSASPISEDADAVLCREIIHGRESNFIGS
jgi:hypothetical protein